MSLSVFCTVCDMLVIHDTEISDHTNGAQIYYTLILTFDPFFYLYLIISLKLYLPLLHGGER